MMNRKRWFATAFLSAARAACLVHFAPSLFPAFNRSMAIAVDKVFADLGKAGSPGCAVGVVRDGQLIYAKGYGLASVELNAPITPESVLDIGSTSKQFTAASILWLEQRGKLSIHDDVRKYIAELPDYGGSTGQTITILHLLKHTSGLRDYLTLLALSGVSVDGVTSNDDALALLIQQKGPNFTRGSNWAYSHTGFFLLSVIVKRASGMTLREFALEEHLSAPRHDSHNFSRRSHDANSSPRLGVRFRRKEWLQAEPILL